MPAPFLLDLTHTSHTRARTGIQRVARSLHAALGDDALAITHDPHAGGWRPLESWEDANLSAETAASKRGARWPLGARIRGQASRLIRGRSAGTVKLAARRPRGLIVPEIFSPGVAAAFPALFGVTRGPKVALFHDAIALQFPELTPVRTVARFPAYLQELLAFDGIAAISDDSRATLLAYWKWLGVAAAPPVRTIQLGLDWDSTKVEYFPVSANRTPVVLSVGSIEGRKNHLSMLEACELLWGRGIRFELHLIGLAHPQTGRDALVRIHALQAAGRPLRYDGPVSDAEVDDAYALCSFTVYPSLVEGFGLPVIESVARGKPCICSARGAIGESARGGGCIALDDVDTSSLAVAIERLLARPADVTALASAARARTFRTWSDYGTDLAAWLEELPVRT